MATREEILRKAQQEQKDEYIQSLYFKVCRNALIVMFVVLFMIYWYFAYPGYLVHVNVFNMEIPLSEILLYPLLLGATVFLLSMAGYFKKKVYLVLGVLILLLFIYGVLT